MSDKRAILANLSGAAYKDPSGQPPPGWKVVDHLSHGSGMQAVAYQRASTGEVVIAYR